jgi:hypothetical protein
MEINYAILITVAVSQQNLFMLMHDSMHADCQLAKRLLEQNFVTI